VRHRFRHYFRGRLHRRIFAWFGLSILLTGLFVSLAWRVTSHGESYGPDVEGARRFVGGRFSLVWDDPRERAELAASIARDLSLGVRIEDAEGRTLSTSGGPCAGGELLTPVVRGGETVGRVALCIEGPKGHRMHFLLPVLVAMVVLWAASGAISRRLLRPLSELARVAEDIGMGRFSSRVRISRRHGGEFGVVGDVMNQMAARIEKQLADQRALLATVSHEIRTPLSRMRLLLEFARDKMIELAAKANAGEAPTAELAALEREVTEIDALVSDLLASSRVDFAAMNRTTLDAAKLAASVLDRAGVDPSCLVADEAPVEFQGDPTLAVRAVTNLVENAKRHGGGVDALRIEARPGSVVFAVEDKGPGFAPGEETRVFEPFYKRATTAGEEGESVGLGLALVKKIAEAHGGRVFAANRPEGGARVAIEFARAAPQAQNGRPRTSP
jgi:two-component system, OmpR family, sensor kinase